jgi:hypothetical protein
MGLPQNRQFQVRRCQVLEGAYLRLKPRKFWLANIAILPKTLKDFILKNKIQVRCGGPVVRMCPSMLAASVGVLVHWFQVMCRVPPATLTIVARMKIGPYIGTLRRRKTQSIGVVKTATAYWSSENTDCIFRSSSVRLGLTHL